MTERARPLESNAANAAIWKTGTAYKWCAHQTSVYSIFLLSVWMKPEQSAHTPSSSWKQQAKAANILTEAKFLKCAYNDLSDLPVISGIREND